MNSGIQVSGILVGICIVYLVPEATEATDGEVQARSPALAVMSGEGGTDEEGLLSSSPPVKSKSLTDWKYDDDSVFGSELCLK